MSAIDDLLARVSDPALRADLIQEIQFLRSDREFGLVFERHLPESAHLPGHPIREGLTVELRGETNSPRWVVTSIEGKKVCLVRHEGPDKVVEETVSTKDLVVVRDFGEPIYPGLRSVGAIKNGRDRPYHAVINAENFHALETLLYTCEGKVDCIYIDPPYNSGDSDWKYNNRYVDSNDAYRHSKWLAFMDRRLRLAKRLLKPDNSVLIVTIDEKEYLRLGLLLEQLFQGQRIQMISTAINPKGSARGKEFYRVDEYIYFVFFGAAEVQDTMVPGLCISKSESESADGNTADTPTDEPRSVRWASLLRSGQGAQREESHLKFYPVLVDIKATKIVGAGDPLPLDQHPSDFVAPEGLTDVWPIRQNSSEGRWQLNTTSFRTLLANGYVKIGSINERTGKVTFYYLMKGQRRQLATGELVVVGQDKYGGLEVSYSSNDVVIGKPKTQWASKAHSATDHGSSLLRKIIPGRKFPYPKSLYAVEDTLRFFVGANREAVVLDFFAGSGTTAHAVMRLNKQDEGHRQSICVTNNEISEAEAQQLTKMGHRPGDPAWEAQGIFECVTKPRVVAAVTGRTPDGEPIKGDYKFTDEFPMAEGFEENVEFFEMTYEDRDQVDLCSAFEAIAPLLWLKAGAEGPRIDKEAKPWVLPKDGRYGILFTPAGWRTFVDAVKEASNIAYAFIVTDSASVFQQVARELPTGVEAVRLYENYLRSFEINTGGVF